MDVVEFPRVDPVVFGVVDFEGYVGGHVVGLDGGEVAAYDCGGGVLRRCGFSCVVSSLEQKRGGPFGGRGWRACRQLLARKQILAARKGGKRRERERTEFHRPDSGPGADVEDVLRVADGREVKFSGEGEEEEVVLEVCL